MSSSVAATRACAKLALPGAESQPLMACGSPNGIGGAKGSDPEWHFTQLEIKSAGYELKAAGGGVESASTFQFFKASKLRGFSDRHGFLRLFSIELIL